MIRNFGNYKEALKPQEQLALVFERIAHKIEEFEALYADQKYEAGYKKVVEVTALCEQLSFIFSNEKMIETYDWQTYFLTLIQTIFKLSSTHNPIMKEKLLKSLRDMATLWRSNCQTEHHVDTNQGSLSLDA